MIFNYKATTPDGRTISGTAEAVSRAALLALLHKQNVQTKRLRPDITADHFTEFRTEQRIFFRRKDSQQRGDQFRMKIKYSITMQRSLKN